MRDKTTCYEREIWYPNGYGASIICNEMSLGSSRKLFEIAVLHNDEIVYNTPVTDNVIGFLDFHEVAQILDQIKALPSKS